VPMTHPDLTSNPDPCTCLWLCSLDVCSTPRTRPSCQDDQPYSLACMPIGCALSMPPARYLHRFSSATPIISPKHPAPTHHRLPPYGSIRTAPQTGPRARSGAGGVVPIESYRDSPTTQNLGSFSDGAARNAHRRIAANCGTRSSAYLSRSLDSYLLTVMLPRLFCFKTVAM
jgi:hypothetical protein